MAGTAGDGEHRLYYLQVRQDDVIATVAIGRGHLTMLALHLSTVLDEVSRLAAVDTAETERGTDLAPLDVPLFPVFTVSQLDVAWDATNGLITVQLADPELEPPYTLDVALTPRLARRFGTRANRVVRDTPACPLCAQPIAPEGHVCPRLDGYRAVKL